MDGTNFPSTRVLGVYIVPLEPFELALVEAIHKRARMLNMFVEYRPILESILDPVFGVVTRKHFLKGSMVEGFVSMGLARELANELFLELITYLEHELFQILPEKVSWHHFNWQLTSRTLIITHVEDIVDDSDSQY